MGLALDCGLVFGLCDTNTTMLWSIVPGRAQRRQTDRQGRGGGMDDGESVVEQNRKVAMNRYPGGRRQYNYPIFNTSFQLVGFGSIIYMVHG